ncbi:MAG: hypothetical protein ACI92E_000316 [Oceanicoccus sp.]|jgi:hypothetical protein
MTNNKLWQHANVFSSQISPARELSYSYRYISKSSIGFKTI